MFSLDKLKQRAKVRSESQIFFSQMSDNELSQNYLPSTFSTDASDNPPTKKLSISYFQVFSSYKPSHLTSAAQTAPPPMQNTSFAQTSKKETSEIGTGHEVISVDNATQVGEEISRSLAENKLIVIENLLRGIQTTKTIMYEKSVGDPPAVVISSYQQTDVEQTSADTLRRSERLASLKDSGVNLQTNPCASDYIPLEINYDLKQSFLKRRRLQLA